MESPLKLYFLPYLAPGHMVPLTEMARLFANQGHHVTIITTPCNATLLQKYTTSNLTLHVLEFPAKEVGLPPGLENFFSVTDLETATKLYTAMTLLQSRIEEFINSNLPDCIIADFYYPWTTDFAARLGIPRLAFQGFCVFAHCLQEAMRGADSPHHSVESDYDPFEVQGLPDRVVITRSRLPDYVRIPSGYTQLMEMCREAEKNCYGLLVNTFYELDPAYTEHYGKIMGHKIWHIGPANLIHRNAEEKVQRSHKTVVDQHQCLGWLDSKRPNSVLYVCFGSGIRWPDEQLYEIASGLLSSGAQFIWVVLGKDKDSNSDSDSDSDTHKWLPEGLEDKMRETGTGMIIRGWAPQVLILDHPAIGGFMTHCGWNSAIEGISAGVPMLTWPLYAEQFYNEMLITQVLKIGVGVGAEDWNLWVDAGNKLILSDKIEMAIKKLMDDGDEALEMRRKAKELGEKARNAVEEGGSSHQNLMALIEDLKRIRNTRVRN